uniref:J domain-containing protein n=1 Tax=Knipowitschia caucasica TaxID=637954 RepID=A0AAV2MJM3_KNICA
MQHSLLCTSIKCYGPTKTAGAISGIRFISQSRIHSKSANHYDLLGIKSDASLEEIKNAFFDKSKKVHPDSDPSNPDLHTQFVKLNEAYRVLSKDKSRKENTDHSNKYSSEAYESQRYWEQFRQSNAHNMSSEAWQKRRTQNQRVLGYCVAAIVLSVGVHYVLFRKLEEVHTNYMDEKDRVITAIYNEAKERARVNSFEKQKEILSQKHAEFLQKYKMRRGGDD